MLKSIKSFFTADRLKTVFAVSRIVLVQILPLVFTTPQFALIQKLALEAVNLFEGTTMSGDEKRTSATEYLVNAVTAKGIDIETVGMNVLNTALELAVGKLKSK